MIEAFHSNWTKPFFRLNDAKEYYLEDFEILITMLSALKWKENNGNIKMVTDNIGAEYYNKIKIDSIWNLGIDVSLDSIDKNIDSNLFWAAGKIYSLKNQKSPCIMLDTDFVVWKSVKKIIKDIELGVIHKEFISDKVYPNKNYFITKVEYNFDPQWNWSVLPCNTAFAYINNEKFKNYYTESAINFMKNLAFGDDKITNMVFAEQRLFSMCAEKMKIEVNELMPLKILSKNEQTYFTHLWGYKNELKNNYKTREKFCINCINRIIKDFPEYEHIIANMPQLKKYYIYK
jgi:hypothetical protein